MTNYIVGQVGNGFVGSALAESFKKRGYRTIIYDKFQKIGTIEDILETNIVFFCLPTPYVAGYGFDLKAITDNLKLLRKHDYNGIVVLKSTIEPGSSERLAEQFGLSIVHNPEFLTARTAKKDFDEQDHIVLGVTKKEIFAASSVSSFYKELYPNATISICTSKESESMKLFCNKCL